MELFKKIAMVVGAFMIAGFILKIIFGIIGAVFSLIFSIKGLLLIAAIALPIYLFAEKKFLRWNFKLISTELEIPWTDLVQNTECRTAQVFAWAVIANNVIGSRFFLLNRHLR